MIICRRPIRTGSRSAATQKSGRKGEAMAMPNQQYHAPTCRAPPALPSIEGTPDQLPAQCVRRRVSNGRTVPKQAVSLLPKLSSSSGLRDFARKASSHVPPALRSSLGSNDYDYDYFPLNQVECRALHAILSGLGFAEVYLSRERATRYAKERRKAKTFTPIVFYIEHIRYIQ